MRKIGRTGEETLNNFGSKMMIKEYRNNKDIDVYFPEYNWIFKHTTYKHFENGKIKCGFTPSIMTTNIFELFSNIQEIGNEIDFTRLSSASPELLIKNISIAGKKK